MTITLDNLIEQWRDGSSWASEAENLGFEQLYPIRHQIIRQIGEKVMVNPLVKRLIAQQVAAQKDGDGLAPKFTAPWQAYAERLTAAFQYAMMIVRKVGDTDDRLMQRECAAHLWMASLMLTPMFGTYLWTNKVHDLVRSAPTPRCKISSVQMPYAGIFFSHEGGHGEGDVISDWSMVMRCGPDGLHVILPNYQVSTGAVDMGSLLLPGNLDFPDGLAPRDKPLAPVIGNIINRISFIRESVLVEARKTRLTKEERKALTTVPATVAPTADPEIYVCVLRRQVAEYRRSLVESGHVEWKHQWWVCGHERNQWCPSEKCHKSVWIAPYIKGPPDKPFLQRVYAVAR